MSTDIRHMSNDHEPVPGPDMKPGGDALDAFNLTVLEVILAAIREGGADATTEFLETLAEVTGGDVDAYLAELTGGGDMGKQILKKKPKPKKPKPD